MGNLVEREASVVDNLIAGDLDLIEVETVIASGSGAYARGTVLSRITASGEFAILDSTHDDGTQLPANARILAEDIDATDAAVTTIAYEQGEFNESSLIFGGTDTAATHRDALLAKKIVLRGSVPVV